MMGNTLKNKSFILFTCLVLCCSCFGGEGLSRIKSEAYRIKDLTTEDREQLLELATTAYSSDVREYAVELFFEDGIGNRFLDEYQQIYDTNLGYSVSVRNRLLDIIENYVDELDGFSEFLWHVVCSESDKDCKLFALELLERLCEGDVFCGVPEQMLLDENEEVRMSVLKIVSEFKSSDDQSMFLVKFLNDRSLDVMEEAIYISGKKKIGQAKPNLLELASSDIFGERINLAAFRALVKIDPSWPSLVSLAEKNAKKVDGDLFLESCKVLSRSGFEDDDGYVYRLIDEFRDDPKGIRNVDMFMPEAIPLLIDLCVSNDNYEVVDTVAAMGLAHDDYSLLKVLNARLHNETLQCRGDYSNCRVWIKRRLLAHSQILNIYTDIYLGGFKVSEEMLREIDVHVHETDMYFSDKKEDYSYLLDDILLYRSLYDISKGHESRGVDMLIQLTGDEYFKMTLARAIVRSTPLGNHMEKFSRKIMSSTASYASMALCDIYREKGMIDEAIDVLENAKIKIAKSGNLISDSLLSGIIKDAFFDRSDLFGMLSGDFADNGFNNILRKESVDLQIYCRLFYMYIDKGNKEAARGILEEIEAIWPITCDKMIQNMSRKCRSCNLVIYAPFHPFRGGASGPKSNPSPGPSSYKTGRVRPAGFGRYGLLEVNDAWVVDVLLEGRALFDRAQWLHLFIAYPWV